MNIIELAVEARLKAALLLRYWGTASALTDTEQEELAQIENFANLVAAHEREACCAIVYGLCESDNAAQRIVDAIRARGTT